MFEHVPEALDRRDRAPIIPSSAHGVLASPTQATSTKARMFALANALRGRRRVSLARVYLPDCSSSSRSRRLLATRMLTVSRPMATGDRRRHRPDPAAGHQRGATHRDRPEEDEDEQFTEADEAVRSGAASA